MPNVINEFPKIFNRIKKAKGWYVYAWANRDWGGVYFYVGKGYGNRALITSGRGMAFTAILNQWDCFPVLLQDGLTEEQAFIEEDKTKSSFIFDWGLPIIDGEGNSAALKNMAIKRAKQIKRATVPGYREGRKVIEVLDFPEFFKKTKNGELSVVDCCKALGISRSKWYKLVREVS